MSLALRIALGYFFAGAGYITLSDFLLAYYHQNTIEPVMSASMIKGILFFLVTAIILYFVLKKFHRRLEEKTHLLNTVVNNTHDLLWLIDLNFKILLANTTFSDTFKKSSEESLVNQDVLSMASTEALRSKWKDLYQRAFSGEEVSHEAAISCEESNPITVAFHLFPVADKKGNVIMVACFGHDISDMKKVQEEMQYQNAALKEITWIQAHEMRRPVVNIKGLVDALDTEFPANPENEQLLKHILTQTDELDGIIHKVVEKTTRFR